MRSRAACFWATPCGRGCSIGANYQSTTVHLPPALATGNLDIVVERDGARGDARQERPRDRRRVRRQDDQRNNATRPGRVSWCSRRAPASPCASCSTRSPRGFRKGSPTPAARSASISWTRSAATCAARSRCSRTCRRTTRTAPAANTCTRPGGSTRSSTPASSASPAATTSSSAAAAACRRSALLAGLEWLTGGSYGRKFKEDARRYYGSFVYFAGRGEMIPNEDSYCEIDPEVEGPVGHSGAALPLEMVGARDAPGRAHAADVRRDHRSDGRPRERRAQDRRREGDRAGRLHHPRGRRRDHGHRSRHLGHQPVVPEPGT